MFENSCQPTEVAKIKKLSEIERMFVECANKIASDRKQRTISGLTYDNAEEIINKVFGPDFQDDEEFIAK